LMSCSGIEDVSEKYQLPSEFGAEPYFPIGRNLSELNLQPVPN
jgi:hypothetical protein